MNTNRATARHIIIKMPKVKEKAVTREPLSDFELISVWELCWPKGNGMIYSNSGSGKICNLGYFTY